MHRRARASPRRRQKVGDTRGYSCAPCRGCTVRSMRLAAPARCASRRGGAGWQRGERGAVCRRRGVRGHTARWAKVWTLTVGIGRRPGRRERRRGRVQVAQPAAQVRERKRGESHRSSNGSRTSVRIGLIPPGRTFPNFWSRRGSTAASVLDGAPRLRTSRRGSSAQTLRVGPGLRLGGRRDSLRMGTDRGTGGCVLGRIGAAVGSRLGPRFQAFPRDGKKGLKINRATPSREARVGLRCRVRRAAPKA